MAKQDCLMQMELDQIYDVAMEAGRILLQNGAEISRVEETMERICRHYGAKSMDSFVLSNGIFITGGYGCSVRNRFRPEW